ncbi:MAG: hypothetical protein KF781_00340 [Chitinophagaceae bacterium]|nr:hypothetical protein [Chitinophagaceae bacterium]MCW5905182.1 hypothetical protein [Chitinophagaceae bacterium]
MLKRNNIFFLVVTLLLLSNGNAYAQQRKTTQKKTKTTNTKNNKKATTKKTTATVTTNTPTTTSNKETVKKDSTVAKVNADTSKPDVVVIYAAFKPSLRNAAKLNFTAATPVIDTVKFSLNYNVPAQNLFFSYQPVPLKPLALFVDSNFTWTNNQYIKAGFGGYSTPYVETGLSFGDGKKKLTSIYGMFTSSKGKLPFQQFSKAVLNMAGNYAINDNHELSGKIYFHNNTQYLYGYQPDTLVFNKKDLKQQFNSVGVQASYTRKLPNAYGLTYSPSLHLNYFFDARKTGEFNIEAKVPVRKTFNEKLSLDVSLTADITAYKDTAKTINNNLFYLNTSARYRLNDNILLNIGLQPAFDNSEINLLPNITVEAKLTDKRFIIQAGWIGYYNKNNYRSLATYNPYLAIPAFMANTKVNEIFGGFKGSAGSHFTYNATVSFTSMINQPLFTNDLVDGKTFIMINEPDLQAIKFHGEVGYSIQEKFSLLAGATIYQFTKSTNDRPFGILPMEITGTLKWQILKDLHLKADLFIWDGTKYIAKNLSTEKLRGAVDMNIGAEYSIMPKLNLWLQFNNLLNNKYQRWNQYEVLGLNVIGGVVYSFR